MKAEIFELASLNCPSDGGKRRPSSVLGHVERFAKNLDAELFRESVELLHPGKKGGFDQVVRAPVRSHRHVARVHWATEDWIADFGLHQGECVLSLSLEFEEAGVGASHKRVGAGVAEKAANQAAHLLPLEDLRHPLRCEGFVHKDSDDHEAVQSALIAAVAEHLDELGFRDAEAWEGEAVTKEFGRQTEG